MFYDYHVLLFGKHKGRLLIAWIAATRGIKHVSKKDILEAEIVKLCNRITPYICSKSASPRDRFSLRLSALLVSGTLRIYRQQVVILLEEFVKVFTVIRPSPGAVSLGKTGQAIFSTPPTPVVQARKRKRREAVEDLETPQSVFEKMLAGIAREEAVQVHGDVEVLPGGVVARADEITLRETVPRPVSFFGVEELGTLGIFSEEDHKAFMVGLGPESLQVSTSVVPLRQLPPEPMVIEEISPVAITEVETVPEEGLSKRKARKILSSSSSESQTAQGQAAVTVVAQVHVDESPRETIREGLRRRITPPQVPPEELISEVIQVETRPREEPMEVTPGRPLREIQVDQVAQDQADKNREKRNKALIAKILITNKRKRNVRINRDSDKLVVVDPWPMPQFRLRPSVNFTPLLNKYFVTHGEASAARAGSSEYTSRRATDSISAGRKSDQLTPDEISTGQRPTQVDESTIPQVVLHEVSLEKPDVQPPFDSALLEVPMESLAPVTSSTPILATATGKRRREATRSVEKTADEIVAVAGEANGVIAKVRKIPDVEPSELGKENFVPTEVHTPQMTVSAPMQVEIAMLLPSPSTTLEERHKDLITKVKNIDLPLTLDEICPPPLTKLNVARCFGDLLTLCKAGYVNLTSEEDSTALKNISKGRKLLN